MRCLLCTGHTGYSLCQVPSIVHSDDSKAASAVGDRASSKIKGFIANVTPREDAWYAASFVVMAASSSDFRPVVHGRCRVQR